MSRRTSAPAGGPAPRAGSLSTAREFLREAARDRATVGAVAPSSGALAHELTRPLRRAGGRAVDVLEVGAGTGSVSRAIIGSLGSASRLDIVEANPRFAESLRVRAGRATERPGAPTLRVHGIDVLALGTARRYDHIVSGLPFANFAPEQVEQVLDLYTGALRPGGTISYFAYRGTRRARHLLSTPAEVARHRAVDAVTAAFRDRYLARHTTVWRNVPPARVWHLSDARGAA